MKMVSENLKASLKAGAIAVSAEVIGTAILMFLGCMGGTTGFKPIPTPSIQGPLVFGMTVASVIQIFGHVSGAHLNPAVTVAAWVFGLTSLPLSLAYIVAQVAGATAGYGLLVAVTPDKILDMGRDLNTSSAFCGTVPAPELTTAQAFFAEFLATSLLIFICCGSWDPRNSAKLDSVAIKFGILVTAVDMAEAITPDHILDLARNSTTQAFCGTAPSEGLTEIQSFFAEFLVTSLLILMCCASWDKRNEAKQDSVAIKFGILVAAISLAEGPYTGGSMNPARSFAPSVFYNAWDSHWIYWVAPMSAGLVIAVLYKFIYTEKVKPEVSANTIEIRNGSTTNDKPMVRVDSDSQKTNYM